MLLVFSAYSYSQRGSEPAPAKQPQDQTTGAANSTPVDVTGVPLTYANFFRVTGTPEELIVDLGLNTQIQAGKTQDPVKMSNRIVMSFYTAKRLEGALHWAVNRYEKNFGELETDYQKRMRQNGEGK